MKKFKNKHIIISEKKILQICNDIAEDDGIGSNHECNGMYSYSKSELIDCIRFWQDRAAEKDYEKMLVTTEMLSLILKHISAKETK